MKQLFTTAGVLFSMTAFAQVGINNTSPKATLDITAKTTGSKPEGLIVPQLTGDQIRAASTGTTPVYGSAQKGLILFASAADTAPAGATANITAPGYYYFDGSVWQKILGSSSGDTTNDAFVNDTGNSMVKIGTKANGTARAAGTDFVVKDDGKVGIGTTSPQASLHLLNSARFELPHRMASRILKTSSDNGDLYWAPANTNYGGGVSTTTASVANGASTTYTFTNTKGMVRIYVGNGCTRYWQKDFDFNTSNSTIAFIVGSGVGNPDGGGTETMTSNSSYSLTGSMAGCVDQSFGGLPVTISISGNTLTVTNNTNAAKTFTITEFPYLSSTVNLYTENGSLGSNRTVTQGTNTLAFTSNATNGFSVDGTTFSVDAANNRVGIGTAGPDATLDVKAISSGTSPEGIIAPRLSLTALQGYTYGTNQTGAIVYVNSVSGTPAGQTANVTAVGYYYFDGTNWQKVANGASVTDATTAAKGIVQLAGDLTGTAASPSIATSAVTSAKIADGTVANADLANMNALSVKGNGTNATAVPTDIAAGTDGYVLRRSGTALGFGTVATAGIADGAITAAKLNQMSASSGQVLGWNGTVWAPTANGISTTLNSGNILVGNASNVATAVTPSGDVTISNTGVTSIGSGKVTTTQIADGTVANADLASGTGGIYKGDGSLSGNTTVTQGTNTLAFTSTASAGTSHFTVDGTTLNVDAVNNRVGIGVAAPKSFLQVSTLNGGASVDAGIFSINNCWLACSQSYTARNIVLNNLNSTNSVFASIDFVPSTDPTAPSGSSIQGIDRDGTNNYAGVGFWTRNASGYGQRMVVKSAGNVGIGTSTPQATLDVSAVSSGTSPEGIIAPRLSLTALQGYTYGTNQTGAIVYVNSVSGTPAGQTANVTAVGYYYFDGTNWLKMTTGASVTDATTTAKGIVQLAGDLSGTAASPSIATSAVTSAKIADGTVANADLASGTGGIYKGGGSLSGNTTVAQGSNTLNFTTSATNGFSVAGSTLSIDGANSRVGIGTIAPIAKLDTRTNPGNSSPGNGAIGIGETTQTASAAGAGAVRYSTTSGGAIEYSNGTAWNTLTSTVKKSLVYGYLTSGQTLASGGGTFNVTESFDQNNDFSSNTFTIPRTGNYSISLCGLTTSSSWNQGEEFSIRVAKNGTTQVVGYWAAPTSTTYYGGSCTSVTISATAGDAITFTYFIGVGGKTIHGADFNRFSIQEL